MRYLELKKLLTRASEHMLTKGPCFQAGTVLAQLTYDSRSCVVMSMLAIDRSRE